MSHLYRFLVTLVCLCVFSSVISAPKAITPSDVYSKVSTLSHNIELIRKALGRPKTNKALIIVKDASPREVYFEAQVLFKKSNRLTDEILGSYAIEPKKSIKNLGSADVLALVNAAYDRVQAILKHYKIKTDSDVLNQKNNATPTDVYNAILRVNQELNALLYHQFSPGDVYEQVTLAVNYMAELLQTFNADDYIPDTKKFISNKTPSEVYARLSKCLKVLRSITNKSGLKLLNVQLNDNDVSRLTPSDVYDLSTIIVSEVSYLNSLIPGAKVLEAYYPGYKTPSEVFQRAGVLLDQLVLLKSFVIKNPKRLNHVSGVSQKR